MNIFFFNRNISFIVHEIERQSTFINANPSEQVPQETRGFNEDTFTTFRLRSKEDAPDYRYMPDPNLGVLVISEVLKSFCVYFLSF